MSSPVERARDAAQRREDMIAFLYLAVGALLTALACLFLWGWRAMLLATGLMILRLGWSGLE